jgi:hypothetical protein
MSLDFKELKLAERTQNHILFTGKVSVFIKERAELEREYAKKMEALVKRHSKKKGALSSDDGDRLLVEEWASTKEAWDRILNDTLEQSKLHLHLSDLLQNIVGEKLKVLTLRKEESRKKVSRRAPLTSSIWHFV